jgi:hypothetical protein
MKKLISKLFLGTDNRLSGVIALGIVAMIALGCTCGKNLDLGNLGKNVNSGSADTSDDSDTADGLPPKGLLDALVAETTADFNYAITLNDFSKMYEKASSDFKNTYTEQEFANTFKDFVAKKRVIIPILAKTVTMSPELSPEPAIRTEQGLDILVVKGKYPTKPVPMTFEYEYVKRGGEWKLLKLIVRLV